jgi:hypothetical protein
LAKFTEKYCNIAFLPNKSDSPDSIYYIVYILDSRKVVSEGILDTIENFKSKLKNIQVRTVPDSRNPLVNCKYQTEVQKYAKAYESYKSKYEPKIIAVKKKMKDARKLKEYNPDKAKENAKQAKDEKATIISEMKESKPTFEI